MSIKVVILCGGRGTRLNEKTKKIPKPLIRIDDKPILYGTAQDALKTMELVYKIYCADADWKERFQLSCEIDKNLR